MQKSHHTRIPKTKPGTKFILSYLCGILTPLTVEVRQPFLWFLVMADIQDGWEYVRAEHRPKLSGVWLSFQISMWNDGTMADFLVIFVISVIAAIQGGQQHNHWQKMATLNKHTKWIIGIKFEFSNVWFNLTSCTINIQACWPFLHWKEKCQKIDHLGLNIHA